jgi:uncharacterized protein YkwD
MRASTLRRTLISAVFSALAVVPASASANPTAGLSGPELRVINYINLQRARHGIAPVQASWQISRAADAHSRAMRTRRAIWHGAFATRVRRQVRAHHVGEVIGWLRPASVRRDPLQIVRMWMNSPGHRGVLLDRGMHWVGVGRVTTGRRGLAFYTADFASGS